MVYHNYAFSQIITSILKYFRANMFIVVANKQEFPSIWLLQVKCLVTNTVFGTRIGSPQQFPDEIVIRIFEESHQRRDNHWWIEVGEIPLPALT